MSSTRFQLAVVLVALAASTGCGFTKPTLTFRNARIRETDLEGTTLDVIYDLKNPNPIGIRLAEVKYGLQVEGHEIVSGKPPNGLSVAKRATSQLIFPAKVIFGQIAPVVQVFLTQETANWKASGEIGIDTPIGIIRLPLSYSGSFPVPKIPRFAFSKPRVEGLSFQGARVVFPLQVTNSNGFPLPLGGFSANLNIAGANVGQANAAMPPLLAAGESRTVELPVQVNFLSAGMAVANAVRGGSAEVNLQGSLKAGGLSLPVNLRQNLSFR